jgi:hypothetical protein
MSITKFLLFTLDTFLAIFIKWPIIIAMFLFAACFLGSCVTLIDLALAD